ncbi:MAG: hypothetical protein M3478_07290 [Planctomycetota bacterium]|nr:hypothetical protein [Planctomycetota bacterium]
MFGWLKLHRIVRRGRFMMLGDGRTMNQPLYIDNFVDLLERAAEVPAAKGRTYIAADAESVTLNQLVKTLGETHSAPVRIIHVPGYLSPSRSPAPPNSSAGHSKSSRRSSVVAFRGSRRTARFASTVPGRISDTSRVWTCAKACDARPTGTARTVISDARAA